MKSNAAKTLYSYWNEIRGSRIAPRRFEIEPSSIANILPETFILEYCNRKSVNFRLSGTMICDLFNREFRGQSIYTLWNDQDRLLLEDALASIADCGSVSLIEATAVTASERELAVEIIMMPLIHSGEKISRLIGTISTTTIQPDVYMREDPIVYLTINQSTHIWPDGRPHKLLPKSVLSNMLPPRIVTSENRRFRVFEGGLSQNPPRNRN